ncbi:hypothetical protein BKA64DRAFT_639406 [Cadophora sp. MPI-SDFR-AT-0126]|nr:hypothetical protein BKA64DRAFT_639406 [Leotiomycetes sp. MPI-SDFR-AT-0126]
MPNLLKNKAVLDMHHFARYLEHMYEKFVNTVDCVDRHLYCLASPEVIVDIWTEIFSGAIYRMLLVGAALTTAHLSSFAVASDAAPPFDKYYTFVPVNTHEYDDAGEDELWLLEIKESGKKHRVKHSIRNLTTRLLTTIIDFRRDNLVVLIQQPRAHLSDLSVHLSVLSKRRYVDGIYFEKIDLGMFSYIFRRFFTGDFEGDAFDGLARFREAGAFLPYNKVDSPNYNSVG